MLICFPVCVLTRFENAFIELAAVTASPASRAVSADVSLTFRAFVILKSIPPDPRSASIRSRTTANAERHTTPIARFVSRAEASKGFRNITCTAAGSASAAPQFHAMFVRFTAGPGPTGSQALGAARGKGGGQG